jgi:hypothetical protein
MGSFSQISLKQKISCQCTFKAKVFIEYVRTIPYFRIFDFYLHKIGGGGVCSVCLRSKNLWADKYPKNVIAAQ